MTQSIQTQARAAGRGSTNGPAFEALARAGFVARGIIYGIIGLLAIQVAIHSGGAITRPTSAGRLRRCSSSRSATGS